MSTAVTFHCRSHPSAPLLLLLVLLSLFSGCSCQIHQYGSKTPYRMIDTDWDQVFKEAELDPGCELSQVLIVQNKC